MGRQLPIELVLALGALLIGRATLVPAKLLLLAEPTARPLAAIMMVTTALVCILVWPASSLAVWAPVAVVAFAHAIQVVSILGYRVLRPAQPPASAAGTV